MYRKIIYISLNLIESMDIMVKICILLCISYVSFLVHYETKPFILKEMNDLEFYSTLSAALILFSGSLYITNANEIVNTFSFIMVIIINIYFGWIWIKSIIIANFQLIERFLPKTFRKIIIYFEKLTFKMQIAFSLYIVSLSERCLKRKIQVQMRKENRVNAKFFEQKK